MVRRRHSKQRLNSYSTILLLCVRPMMSQTVLLSITQKSELNPGHLLAPPVLYYTDFIQTAAAKKK